MWVAVGIVEKPVIKKLPNLILTHKRHFLTPMILPIRMAQCFLKSKLENMTFSS